MISILGCGWYGLALGKTLVESGIKVNGSTTSSERMNELQTAGLTPYLVNLIDDSSIIDETFFNCETLVISIPPKLRSGEGDVYLTKLQLIISAVIKYQIKQVIYISSTGVYTESNAVVDETIIPEPDTASGKILFAAEELFKSQTKFDTTIIRFGGLVGPGRHPGRFFAGKINIANGRAPVNLIHLQDCIGITLSILNKKAFGYTFNACSPNHPAKATFYTQAALHSGLGVPEFIDELQDWKTISSVNIPSILNYQFVINNWQHCFTANCF